MVVLISGLWVILIGKCTNKKCILTGILMYVCICSVILMWNCMARSISISIDPLGLYNFKMDTDSIKCTYESSKKDQAREKVSQKKNVYANPFEPHPFMWQLVLASGYLFITKCLKQVTNCLPELARLAQWLLVIIRG